MKTFLSENLRWAGIISALYAAILLFQIKVVFPVEAILMPENVLLASVVFLPHGMRILSVVIVGPKAFIALFPTRAVFNYFFADMYSNGSILFEVFDAVIGPGSAVIAYLIVRSFYRTTPEFRLGLRNWRIVLLIGLLGSVLNSVFRAVLYLKLEGLDQVWALVSTVIVGDMVGLVICLVALVFAFRLFRRRPVQS